MKPLTPHSTEKSNAPSGEGLVPSLPLTFLFLFLLTLFVFINSLDNEFLMWDDTGFIYMNPFITDLNWENIKIMATAFHYSNWQPLSWFSHAIDYHFFGLNPTGHHLTSVLLHCMNTFWVFLLVRELLRLGLGGTLDRRALWWSAMLGALVFGLHPLRVESVAWVSERKDVLSAFFAFPVYLAYFKYVAAKEEGKKKFWFATALILFFLSLTAKPMPLTLPVILLLLDYFPLGRWKTRRDFFALLFEKKWFFALSLASAAITVLAQKHIGAITTLEQFPVQLRIANALNSLCVVYLGKTLLPVGLTPLYPLMQNLRLVWDLFLLPAVIFAGISLACYRAWRRGWMIFALAWLYYIITLSPVIGIVQVGSQAAADRYTYFPSLAFSVLIASGLYLLSRFDHSIFRMRLFALARTLLCLAVVMYSVLTVRQIKVWGGSLTLWSEVVKHYPSQDARALVGQSSALLVSGKVDEAIEKIRFALRVYPKTKILYLNLGTALTLKGEYPQAESAYKQALVHDGGFSSAYNALGRLYSNWGRMEEAEQNYLQAIKFQPEFTLAIGNLGELYMNADRLDEAEEQLNKAIEIDPLAYRAFNAMGRVFLKRKRYDEAKKYIEKALSLSNLYYAAYNDLGMVYEATGKLDKAEESYLKALEIVPRYMPSLVSLAALYERSGRAEEARALQDRISGMTRSFAE